MRMSEKCCSNKHNNNNSDNPLTSRRTNGGKNQYRMGRIGQPKNPGGCFWFSEYFGFYFKIT